MSLTVRPGRGVGRILDLDADVAFAGDACSWVGDALPLVTAARSIAGRAPVSPALPFMRASEREASSHTRDRTGRQESL